MLKIQSLAFLIVALCGTLPVAGANGALQGEKLFGETAQDLQRGVLVGQEHVAPHRRITGGDPGEIPEPGGGILDHFAVGDPPQIVGDWDCNASSRLRQTLVMSVLRWWSDG